MSHQKCCMDSASEIYSKIVKVVFFSPKQILLRENGVDNVSI
ncbi:hypothetical protein [Methanobrevibacter sp.]